MSDLNGNFDNTGIANSGGYLSDSNIVNITPNLAPTGITGIFDYL